VSPSPERSTRCISRCHSCSFSASSWSSLGRAELGLASRGAQTGIWGGTDWHLAGHRLASGEMEAQGAAKPHLPVSVRRWQSCATSAEGARGEGRGSARVLGPVLSPGLVPSPELVLSRWWWLLGVDSLGSAGSSSSLVSLVPSLARQLVCSPRSAGAEGVVGTERCPMASAPSAPGTKWGAGPYPFPSTPKVPPAHPRPDTLFLHPPGRGGGTQPRIPAVSQCHPPLTSTVRAACTARLTASSSANIQWGLM